MSYAADTLEYRLKQIDLDGTASLTDPISIERAACELVLRQPVPNPTREKAIVRFAVPDRQEITLHLCDTMGRQVRTLREGVVEGRQKQQVDVSGLLSGAYCLRLQAGGQMQTQQVTVVK